MVSVENRPTNLARVVVLPLPNLRFAGGLVFRCRLAPSMVGSKAMRSCKGFHHGVVEERHVGHAAVWVTRIEIGAEHAILFRGRGCDAHFAGNSANMLASSGP